jgi:hypothetical protein
MPSLGANQLLIRQNAYEIAPGLNKQICLRQANSLIADIPITPYPYCSGKARAQSMQEWPIQPEHFLFRNQYGL